jgi:hypothetical protein
LAGLPRRPRACPSGHPRAYTENISRGEGRMVRGARNSEEKRHSPRWYIFEK